METGNYELGRYMDICPNCGSRMIKEKCESCGLTNKWIEVDDTKVEYLGHKN